MRIFEDSKASSLYVKYMEMLDGKSRVSFAKSVQKLFDVKTVSQEGEFSSFQITVGDLKALAIPLEAKKRLLQNA